MPLIKWDKNLMLGIKEIDDQHQKWIGIINRLSAETEGKALTVYSVKKTINELIDYTNTHFSLEEIYFKAFGYNDIIPHIEEHKYFIRYIEDIKQQYKPEIAFSLAPSLLSHMMDWIINHIQKTDRGYIDLFSKNGIV